MELEIRVMDQFVNEEGSDQERACWRKIRSAMCEANSNAVLCEVCAYWLEDPEFKGMGSCGNDDVNNKLVFGHADYFLISADFGCKFFKKM